MKWSKRNYTKINCLFISYKVAIVWKSNQEGIIEQLTEFVKKQNKYILWHYMKTNPKK